MTRTQQVNIYIWDNVLYNYMELPKLWEVYDFPFLHTLSVLLEKAEK